MTLKEAAKQFTVSGLDATALERQEGAFKECIAFLTDVAKTKLQNKRHSSYSLKHIIENPSGRFGISDCDKCYFGYIYEGTLVLAALALGFTRKPVASGLKCTFNISEPSLRKRAKEVAAVRSARVNS